MLRVLLTVLIVSHLQLWSSSAQGKSRERENEIHINQYVLVSRYAHNS